MKKRGKRACVRRLEQSLTGKVTLDFYRIVIDTVRQWCDDLAPGDLIAFRCESANPDKQYYVWGRWLLKKESKYKWVSNPELKCFTFYKKTYVE